MPRAALLTGERGAGKSTLCLSLSALSDSFGGIVCPAKYSPAGEKIGFNCRCLTTGDEWELGRIDRSLGGPEVGIYSLSDEGVLSALSCLETSLADLRRVTVIDEIGPLELSRGLGFAPILPGLMTAANLLIVVREELIGELTTYIPDHRRQVFTVTAENCGETRDEIALFFR